MELLTRAAWWGGEVSLVCLAYRAWREGLFNRYRFFWAYLIYVAESDVLRIYLQNWHPPAWVLEWWITEILGAIFGFCVLWEIFAQLLTPYQGVRRMARMVVGGVLVLVIVKGGIDLAREPFLVLMPTTAEIVRNLRVVQALLLLTVVGLVRHYSLPMGRNVRFLLVGYGAYIGAHVVTLTLQSAGGPALQAVLRVLPGPFYCATLMIWCVGMWSWHPNPGSSSTIEGDYERLSRHTIRAMDRLRAHLIQSWRI